MEIGILYVVLYIAKVAGVDLRVLSISSVITQMIAVMLLPIICLLVFRKDTGSLFRIRHTYLLLLLCIMYCVFFVVHQQFNMPGFYLFIQDLIIIGFSEEYLYRGVMYLFIGYGFIYVFEESKTLWIPILLHAVYDYSMGYGWIIFVGTVMYLYIVNKVGHTRQK